MSKKQTGRARLTMRLSPLMDHHLKLRAEEEQCTRVDVVRQLVADGLGIRNDPLPTGNPNWQKPRPPAESELTAEQFAAMVAKYMVPPDPAPAARAAEPPSEEGQS